MQYYSFYVARIKALPLSKDPELRREEIYATLFPRSAEARRVDARRRCAVDHLVYTCAELKEGIKAIEKLTGVRAAVGGQHLGIGTHNALLSLGDDVTEHHLTWSRYG